VGIGPCGDFKKLWWAPLTGGIPHFFKYYIDRADAA
tara:strand:- start:599 stop:706 length:108 start_codon:yes stop_codon:yes gene_type:complete